MLPLGPDAPAAGFFAVVEEPRGVAGVAGVFFCLRCTVTAGLCGEGLERRGAGATTIGLVGVPSSGVVVVVWPVPLC